MVVFTVELDHFCLKVGADFGERFPEYLKSPSVQHLLPVLGHKDQMNMHIENAMPACANIVVFLHRPKYNIAHEDTQGI